MNLTITHDWATLSRGRICAKHVKDGTWAERGNGTVIIDRAGKWMLSATDGFSRKETIYVVVSDSGEMDLPGRTRFSEI